MTRKILLLSVCLAQAIFAQKPEKYEEAEVTGHTVLPERLSFSEDHLKQLKVPPGFSVSVFAKDLGDPRMMAFAAGGTLFVTRPDHNDALALRNIGKGQPPENRTLVSGVDKLHGIWIHQGKIYLAGVKQVLVADLPSGTGTLSPREIMRDLPDGGQHGKRTLGVGPDGMLYVSIGSDCNACRETNPMHATMLRSKLDGTERTVFAKGLRNTIGFDWHPETREMWGIDNGSDWLGDNVPPEELNRIEKDGNYGWPQCFGKSEPDRAYGHPEPGMTREEYCGKTKPAILTYQPHSAPIGFLFYNGNQFPPDYRGNAFAVFRGSWNRKPATGYKVSRVVFEHGRPVRFEDFLTGFLSGDGKSYFARPSGLAEAPDGSLLVSDDTNGVIYRVTYQK